VLANVLLIQVNSSNSEFAVKSFTRLLRDKVMWAGALGTILGLLLILYTPLCNLVKLAPLSLEHLLTATGIAVAAVLWYELVKMIKYLRKRSLLSAAKASERS